MSKEKKEKPKTKPSKKTAEKPQEEKIPKTEVTPAEKPLRKRRPAAKKVRRRKPGAAVTKPETPKPELEKPEEERPPAEEKLEEEKKPEEAKEERPEAEAPGEEIVEERLYTIPLRITRYVPRWKRTPRAVRFVREFITRHMKPDNVIIMPEVNEALWARSIKKPPSRIRVRAVKNADGDVKLYLAGA